MSFIILPLAMGKVAGKTGLFKFGMATGLRERKFLIQIY